MAKVEELLLRFGTLRNYPGDEGENSEVTANAVTEIASEAKALSGEVLNRVLEASTEEEFVAALQEFRERLRHIDLHLRNCAYFSVIAGSNEVAHQHGKASN